VAEPGLQNRGSELMSVIILEPVGGLCNRMRAIASALALAKDLDRQLWLLWRRDATLNCAFEELFETPLGVNRIVTLSSRLVVRSWDLFASLYCDGRWDEHEVADWIDDESALVDLKRTRRAFLRTSSQFYKPCSFDGFRPVEGLQKIIDRYQGELVDAIGLHIRRSDNEKSRGTSPTELFVKAMEDEIQADPEVRFFLATDSEEEEALMSEKFGARLLTHSKQSLRRDDPAAIRDAVIDLYCLSSCRMIYGSFWSSFSETAQRLGSAELHVLSRKRS
jgi:hypothetical protein